MNEEITTIDESVLIDNHGRFRTKELKRAVRDEVISLKRAIRADVEDLPDRIRTFEATTEHVLRGLGRLQQQTESEIATLSADGDPILALSTRDREKAMTFLPVAATDVETLNPSALRTTVEQVVATGDTAAASAYLRVIDPMTTSTVAEGMSAQRRRVLGELRRRLQTAVPRQGKTAKDRLTVAERRLVDIEAARKHVYDATAYSDRKKAEYLNQGRRWMKLDAQQEQRLARQSARNASPTGRAEQ